jgi:hypothetical protein
MEHSILIKERALILQKFKVTKAMTACRNIPD